MFSLESIMSDLSNERPIFHSEADFQHALAWKIHEKYPNYDIRLEKDYPKLDKRKYLDILVSNNSSKIAIELKYKKKRIEHSHNNESFNLTTQHAQDIARYDFCKDIGRLEGFVSKDKSFFGYAIFLTNDPLYWKDPKNIDSVDSAFRICDRNKLRGSLEWKGASEGTMKGRREKINLNGQYDLGWKKYSEIQESENKIKENGIFQYLAVKI